MMKVVNMVGSGSLDIEIELETLSDDTGHPRARYDPEMYPGLYFRFEEDAPLITL
jgi:transcription initiation factor TFIID TATA-box-binding protein